VQALPGRDGRHIGGRGFDGGKGKAWRLTYKVQRRVAGEHDFRVDGMADLLHRARGASVFDIGCNRGMVGFEFARNGAAKVHGCDIFDVGINTAREVFADLRSVDARFEVVDLTGGPKALGAFSGETYDITLCLATYHTLKVDTYRSLVQHFELVEDSPIRINVIMALA
jgi:2-polyprenyl-3-methyl-5-hydroxy-6-metoxy-1,4-benzoquinol methylase